MNKHKITLVNKKTEKLHEIFIQDFIELYSFLEEIFELDMFFIDIEINLDIIKLEEYIALLKIQDKKDEMEIPDEIDTVEELEDWIQSWKILDYIYKKYSFK